MKFKWNQQLKQKWWIKLKIGMGCWQNRLGQFSGKPAQSKKNLESWGFSNPWLCTYAYIISMWVIHCEYCFTSSFLVNTHYFGKGVKWPSQVKKLTKFIVQVIQILGALIKGELIEFLVPCGLTFLLRKFCGIYMW